MTHLRCYSTSHNAPDCIEADMEPDDMCSNCRDHYDATTGAEEAASLEPDLSDHMGESYRLVDKARADASTMWAVGWHYPDCLPAAAHNYRVAAAANLAIAEALEMEEIEGKEALKALMGRIPLPSPT